MATPPVILSYGMGTDSTAILLRWLLEPSCRDFALADLIVLTAQTGDEFPDTRRLVEHHMLPRLRAQGIRYVQVARAGLHQAAGVAVLSDTRQPLVCHTDGAFALSTELLAAGTVPQYAHGQRRCSQKYKGWVLDHWIAREMGGRPFRHVIGFNADEDRRAVRDQGYTTALRHAEHPLREWGWDRQHCEAYVAAVVGEPWQKSCCVYCPFSGGRAAMLGRYRQFPEEAGRALFLEHISRALNPRMALYAHNSLHATLEADGNVAALDNLTAQLAHSLWALYRVRRVFHAVGRADRKVECLARGSAAAMQARLVAAAQTHAMPLTAEDGIPRLYLQPKGAQFPCVEELLVACPAVVEDKGRDSFERGWQAAQDPVQQLRLL